MRGTGKGSNEATPGCAGGEGRDENPRLLTGASNSKGLRELVVRQDAVPLACHDSAIGIKETERERERDENAEGTREERRATPHTHTRNPPGIARISQQRCPNTIPYERVLLKYYSTLEAVKICLVHNWLFLFVIFFSLKHRNFFIADFF